MIYPGRGAVLASAAIAPLTLLIGVLVPAYWYAGLALLAFLIILCLVDAAIGALQVSPGSDVLQVQRLKKRKLHLRDRITFIEDQLTPDIIA